MNQWKCRGIRGATTAAANTREDILWATRELLERIVARNEVLVDDIASIFFTVSDDLNAEYPALAARQLGWTEAALLCAREIPVPEPQVSRCIRVLLHVNTTRPAAEIRHVYLREAVALRPSRADVVGVTSARDEQRREPATARASSHGVSEGERA